MLMMGPASNHRAIQDPYNMSSCWKKHNPSGFVAYWSTHEQSILEDGLRRYALEANILQYAKIAMKLPTKTVRDVALRCRWMSSKEISRRKREGDLIRKFKEKKDRFTDPLLSAHLATLSNFSQLRVVSGDSYDGISYKAISNFARQLEQNDQALKQISTNLASHQLQHNIDLFCRIRDNIFKIMIGLNDLPNLMNQTMPALPVTMNEELVNLILPIRMHS